MKKCISNKLFTAVMTAVMLSTLALSSCRPQSDELLSYGQNDNQVFRDGNFSFAEEFKDFWSAMNENYCIWDFEQAHGLDWDEVYDTYLPKFKELDTRNGLVSDEELAELYRQFVDSLLDGHMYVEIKNLSTGNYIYINPNQDRIARERQELYLSDSRATALDYYRTPAADASYRIYDYDATSPVQIVTQVFDSVATRCVKASNEYIAAVEAAGGPTPLYDTLYQSVVYMKKAFEGLLDILQQYPESALMEGLGSLVAQYNSVSSRCTLTAKQLGVTLTPIDNRVANDNLRFIRYARFEGDIVYLRFGAFYLSPHLVPYNITSDTTSMYYAYQMAVNRVWHNWFDAIQELHAAGQLGGVILDMRGNSGGMVNDFQFAMGALLPSGGWSGSKGRVKNGPGRLDFAPLVPLSFSTYEEEHAVINDVPIVVLANTASGSLAENTTWSVMCQPNGYFIGTRTYGALSALNVSPENYSQTYSGAFGVRRVTPIYGSLPKFVILYGDDLHIAEGHGFDPDKEVVLDVNLYNSTGRDNQLESALDYIHSK